MRAREGDAHNAAAAPATVSGECPAIVPLGATLLGRRPETATREPGDLPPATVTRERVGRGVLASLSPVVVRSAQGRKRTSSAKIAVTGRLSPPGRDVFPVSFNGRRRGRCVLVPVFSTLLAAFILKTTAAAAQNAAGPQQVKPGSQPLPQISVSGQRPVQRPAIKRRPTGRTAAPAPAPTNQPPPSAPPLAGIPIISAE